MRDTLSQMRLPTGGVRRTDDAAHLDRAFAIGRACVVPLAMVASITADNDDVALGQPFLIAAAAVELYSVIMLAALLRGRPVGPRTQFVLDLVAVAALALVADPHASSAGRIPLLLLLSAWGLTLAPRVAAARALLASAVVVGGEALLVGVEEALLVALFLGTVAILTTGFSVVLERRRVDVAALERRLEEAGAEASELERRERERLAQLLHDDALQRLLAARQDLDHAREGDPSALQVVADGLAETTRSLRSLTIVHHDAILEAAGVEAAVRRIVDDAERRADLQTEVRITGQLSAEVSSTVLAIVRELVANVERHADATRMTVDISAERGALSIVVADDGRGMSERRLADAERDGHLGHATLRRRVEDVGGALAVATAPGAGCRVTVRLEDEGVREHRVLQEALKSERSWNAALVTGFPHPFVVASLDLRLVEVSDRFVRLTGWTRAELLNAPAGDLPYWPPELKARVPQIAREAERSGEYVTELEIVRRDGGRLRVITTSCVVRDPRGNRDLHLVTFQEAPSAGREERRATAGDAAAARSRHSGGA